ncbi:MAG: O-antigen ligase family protein [Alphaproteobacteria bacterium]
MLAPVLGVFGPKLIAPLAMLVVLGLLGCRAWRREPFPPIDWRFTAVTGVIVIWSGISLAWTLDPVDGARKWVLIFVAALPVLATFAIVKSLAPEERRIAQFGILAGITASFFLIVFDLTSGGMLSGLVFPKDVFTIEFFNRSPSVLLIFIWPAVAILLPRSRVFALVLLAAGIALGLILPSEAALGGYAVGIAVFAAVWFFARATRIFLTVALFIGIMTAPVMTKTVMSPDTLRDLMPDVNSSLLHRLQIWDFTSQHIAERPVLGWGFRSARIIPGGQERYLVRNRDGHIIGEGDRLPLHPHNGALQVWLELGLPGALAIALLLALLVWRTGGIPDRASRAAGAGMLATMMPIWLFSFGVWQGWWLSALILAGVLMTVTLPPAEASR